ncbi:molybdopterin-dependent oxidoreductase [Agrobacterium vitis]|uniref:molybdopterin-containing oxidoreductase family protein n=1 Tax=Rhizobium/Agrobacterium group TaxID=227290 RepID=UPI0008FB80FE|nr:MULTISPECIES: molybdopterin-dependent oxidoreductase [Rhizobium/Agrobacterium group]MCF1436307.1 molybdopterin-dependent oxidoreductase [Allorhizobium ampelinum]MUO88901.1 molybdopterin-dependent oxidoreductase [Agrobacterium vitis]MUZ53340.1 molybdopterin-dependent oxidoreductase [Agrobacterium vitis]MUZ94088.1 molybdopterin-dependent oxidoreductase [Agrobacterium vitis]MVA42088.1 molybdopterin-dependent oxidoreductase [Agrobacterium vitis]
MARSVVVGACPHDCPDTCSILTTVEDGKALAVRGNPDHPFTRGRLCVKVNNYQDRVYSDKRLLYPMRRVGPKGSGQFVRISWNDALEEIATRWKDIIASDGAQAILPYSYLGTQGILNGLNVGDPLFNKLGASVSERTFCDSGSCTAYMMTIGHTPGVDPESFVHSKYIILWACNTLSTNSHHWPFIEEARKNGAKLVVIDPVRTRTARLADWHIPIRPGTDGALAMAMMHVIITENLVDRDYVDKHTLGYDELVERVAEYTPEFAYLETGIPVDDILKLAREYATTPAAVVRIGVAVERHAGGGQTVRAIACLPALIGAWKHVGGGLLQLPIWAFPVNWGGLMRPDLQPEKMRVINSWRLGQALTGALELDPPIRALFVYNANPMAMVTEQEKLEQGLGREDLFTVVSEHFITDTARYADILLPATTQLEQKDIMFSWGHLYLSYNNPAIEPLGEAVSNTELFRRLAGALGIDDPFFFRSDDEMIEASMDWASPVLEGITLDQLKQSGYMRLNMPAADRWAPHRDGNFPTPTGKCEFKSTLAEGGNFVAPLFRQGYGGDQSGEAVDPLPHYIRPNESPATHPVLAQQYPLSLISPKSHAFLNSNYGNLPAQIAQAGEEQAVLLHPDDASERGIIAGAPIRVFNDRGMFEAFATLSPDVMRGVVVAPSGYWQRSNRKGATVHAVTPPAYADLGRAPTFSDALVQVAMA